MISGLIFQRVALIDVLKQFAAVVQQLGNRLQLTSRTPGSLVSLQSVSRNDSDRGGAERIHFTNSSIANTSFIKQDQGEVSHCWNIYKIPAGSFCGSENNINCLLPQRSNLWEMRCDHQQCLFRQPCRTKMDHFLNCFTSHTICQHWYVRSTLAVQMTVAMRSSCDRYVPLLIKLFETSWQNSRKCCLAQLHLLPVLVSPHSQ